MRPIERPRLLALIPELLRSRVTLVVAPVGSGKSTLLRQWMLALEPQADLLPISWRVEHNSPSSLRAEIARAASAAVPQLQWNPPDQPSGADLASFSAAVSSHERRRPDVPIVIVLDDVHVLTDPSVLGMLGAAIELLPDDVRFVIASDAPVPLLLARRRLTHDVLELGAAELAFDDGELAAAVGDARARLAREVTGGWAAAVGAVIALSDPLDLVRHYVRDELVRGLTPQTRTALLETAVLPEIDPGVADLLRGTDDTASALDELTARGRHPTKYESVWRHPPVVRQALAELLAEESPQRSAELMTRVAELETAPLSLSSRELEVLAQLDSDAAITAIAESLSISYHTARTHVRSIYAKLGVSSRAGAVRRARDAGLLAP